ncbi:MAG TPA: hypothetical protein VMG36_06190 [Thermoplasmata archaeon]|nr:hypothetical protein [Thermoplasmata archaeon]
MSPHPGTLDVYEVAPAGATTEDPAAAYDTVSYEPILNVYQTLINYNGASTTTFVPTLATCVPGTSQCVTDYGTNLTGYVAGEPIYWTFVIDKNARFYDPSTGNSWPVEPSDVMFSLARTMSFADQPYAGKAPGWIQTQALLPYGNPNWDNALHYPYNNTPGQILSSMLINDSTYCPSAALTSENGCVTFIANGGGQDWPFFLELVADNLGASIVPCGWFTAQGAGIPGWAGTHAAHGDGSCTLPNGGTSTNGAGWASYVAGLSPTAWDSLDQLENSPGWPAPQPNVQWNMVGSGPYAAAVTPGTGYQLERNPDYQQPSGCSGAGGVATYGGYCDPAPGTYIANVNVFWEPDDSFGISQYEAGQADFAGIEQVHTSTLKSLQASGKLDIYQFPTISSFFTPINLDYSSSAYASDFPSEPTQNIPSTFFDNLALRNFYVDAYPYNATNASVNTVDGISFDFNAGGPIPFGMGNYYPANVTFPYELNNGNPDTNPNDVGGAAWWWAQANDPTSPYYDSGLSACTVGSPCTWAIAGLAGDPSGDITIADWIASIESLSGGVLKPFGGSSFDLTFTEFLTAAFASPYESPLVSETGTGWAPDYPDPTDYMTPMALPDSTYTGPETFSEVLNSGPTAGMYNAPSCGHVTPDWANLTYWAGAAAAYTLPSDCQGVAYNVSVAWQGIAAALPVGPQRTLDYNEIEFILNGLAMFVYDGQENAVLSAAPWIDGSSINTNVMIGGGGDQVYFQVRYVPYESAVTFKESGLPVSASWGVSAGSPPQLLSNTTTSHGGTVVFEEPNGSVPFSVTAPAGYAVAKITGPDHPGYTTATATGHPVTYTVVFGALQTVTFTELEVKNWPGLPAGSTWTVTLTPPATGDMPGQSASTSGTSIAFSLPKGASFKFQVTKISPYSTLLTTYKAAGGHGSFGVPAVSKNLNVKFSPFNATITFVVHGLPHLATFDVNVVGLAGNVLPYGPVWENGTTTSEKFGLQNGTYNYTVETSAPGTLNPAGPVTFVVTAPHGQSIVIVYTAAHGQSVSLANPATTLHNNLIATPSGGRETV